MNLQSIWIPAAGVAAVALACRLYGWTGVAAAPAGLTMWLLLHFTRMMQVLKRAADRPTGYVDSAVMLNAKLRPGLTLLQVVAMPRVLGELQSLLNAQPEIFRWTDGTQSSVTCTFMGGKLVHYELSRPAS